MWWQNRPVVQDIVGSEADPEEHFVVLEQLGEGNFGSVYKAYHKDSGLIVAIKVVPITLTASGIAGLIITLGMAVDANVLIFERTKEELKSGKSRRKA